MKYKNVQKLQAKPDAELTKKERKQLAKHGLATHDERAATCASIASGLGMAATIAERDHGAFDVATALRRHADFWANRRPLGGNRRKRRNAGVQGEE